MNIPLSSIKPNPKNPRVIKDQAFEKLKKSISDFPKMMALRPIVVDENGIALGGNQRLKALKDLGYKEIPEEWVKKASELSEEEKSQFMIKDNNNAGEWDWEILKAEWDVPSMEEWGLSIPELEIKEAAAEDDDYEPPKEIKTDIVIGDLFEIGIHRLLCGDSSESDNYLKLMADKRPSLMVTDPPYGVNYDPSWRAEARKGKIKSTSKVLNDHKDDWAAVYSLYTGNVAYIWHGSLSTHVVANDLINCDYKLITQIIWNKSNGALSRGDIHWKHEPCWYAVKNGEKHNWQGARNIWSVWDIQNLSAKSVADSEGQTGHSTQKPIKCFSIPIENSSNKWDIVYDPFMGSGTSMVAGEQLSRPVYGMELSPSHCQMIIDRMIKNNPSIIIKRNGEKIHG